MVDPHAPLLTRLKASPRLHEPGWVLLPLRAFLGVTFVYAGLLKLSDPTYLDSASTNSVHAQMLRAATTSPIGPLVRLSADFATVTGLLIAFGELAVGIGVLLGLWTRVAALGGLLLSLSFFLTVSWSTSPYFFGSDIVFFFAWSALLIGGDGGVYSLSTWIRRSVRTRLQLPPEPVRAEKPALLEEVDRRTLIRTGGIAAAVGGVALAGGGISAVMAHGRAPGAPAAATTPTSTPTTTSTDTAAPTASSSPTATPIAAASAVQVGGSAPFTDPVSGGDALVIQPSAGVFKAFSAICPHQGCTVGYGGGQFQCPCHGSTFDGSTGAVLTGPAQSGLSAIAITVSGGQIYEA
jgi:thiosulfate dehydrogenase [quinone] large subunit